MVLLLAGISLKIGAYNQKQGCEATKVVLACRRKQLFRFVVRTALSVCNYSRVFAVLMSRAGRD